jgi:hypothetical protein
MRDITTSSMCSIHTLASERMVSRGRGSRLSLSGVRPQERPKKLPVVRHTQVEQLLNDHATPELRMLAK